MSGGAVACVYLITPEGWKFIGRDDVSELFYKYSSSQMITT